LDPASPPLRITQINIIGERHSGTNLLFCILSQNLQKDSGVSLGEGFFSWWKHGFQTPEAPACSRAPAAQRDPRGDRTLVLVVLRSPVDYLLAMHRLPYHAPQHDLSIALGRRRVPGDPVAFLTR
jgi:hypothetical protein